VFLIVLSDRGFTHSFGANSGYLSGVLRRQGELFQNYYAVAGAPLANEIALISGQGPTPQTASDCPSFAPIKPGRKGPRGQVLGTGCVYPPATKSLVNQLGAAGHTWKAYVAEAAASAQAACRVPKLGSKQGPGATARSKHPVWRNPFLYFRSLTTGTACRQNVVAFGQLAKDVKSATSAPSFAYIVPPLCATGSEAPCKPGAPTTLVAADRFLRSVVPKIKRSAAYKDGGLIAITFDQAPQTGPDADPSACCGTPPTYPNLRRLATPPAVPPEAMGETTASPTSTTGTDPGSPMTSGTATTSAGTTTGTTGTDTSTGTTTTGTTTGTTPATTTPATSLGDGETTPTGGGGQVGLLVISRYVKPGSIDVINYFNHFSLLATIEDLFGLHRLGYAGAPGLPVMGPASFNNYTG
jgi:phosphatidylinositol-3-phosphatase